MTTADLVVFLMTGGKLLDFEDDPRFENLIDECRALAATLLGELGTVLETDGRSGSEVLKDAPLRRRRPRFKVMAGGRS
jgi:hypothetical protein